MEYQLLVCIVKDDDVVESILTGFLGLGIAGASVINARGMGEIIASQVPLFAGFKDVFKAGGSSRVILAAMPSAMVPEIHNMIAEYIEPDVASGLGVSFAIPIVSELALQRQVFDEP